jgi:hypothetical protein
VIRVGGSSCFFPLLWLEEKMGRRDLKAEMLAESNASSALGAAASGQGQLVLAQGTPVNLVFQVNVSSSAMWETSWSWRLPRT